MTQQELPTTPWGYIAYRMDRYDERMAAVERDLAVVKNTTITRKAVLMSLVVLAPLMAGAVTLAFQVGNALWGNGG